MGSLTQGGGGGRGAAGMDFARFPVKCSGNP